MSAVTEPLARTRLARQRTALTAAALAAVLLERGLARSSTLELVAAGCAAAGAVAVTLPTRGTATPRAHAGLPAWVALVAVLAVTGAVTGW